MEGTASVMGTATEALVSSFTEIAAELAGLVGSILPIALPIIGVVLVVTFGLKIFKKTTGKAA